MGNSPENAGSEPYNDADIDAIAADHGGEWVGFDETNFDGYDFEERPDHQRKFVKPRTAPMAKEVKAAVRSVLRAANGYAAAEMDALISQIRISAQAISELDEYDQRVLRGVLEVLDFEIANLTDDAVVDLAGCAHLEYSDSSVIAFFATIPDADPLPPKMVPRAVWLALVNEVTARHTRRATEALNAAIDERAPAADQVELFDKIQAPASRVAVIREAGLLTVDQMIADFEAEGGVMTPYRLSSGYPTLDVTQTSAGQEIGSIVPGEMLLVLGATGTGKSSFEYAVQRASTLDLTLRYPDAVSMLLHTEESSMDKAKAIGLLRDQRWHFLAKNIFIENIGSSRRRIGEVFFESIAAAVRRSEKTGRSPIEFATHKVHIDYIQALKEAGEQDNMAVNTTAELILRGLQECNPEEIEKFSGVNFESYTNMRWPQELDSHRVAVVCYGQLRKATGDAVEYYDPKDRKHSLPTFSLEDTGDNAAWTAPDGSKWCWDVRTGDFRLFTKNDIYGSSKPLQNATSVLLLHRSVPQKNPIAGRDENGNPHLADTRGRFLLDKARNGQQALYVPMSFDVMPDGFRAQYFDPIGHEVVTNGGYEIEQEFYQGPGDPMIPKRDRRSVFSDMRYS